MDLIRCLSFRFRVLILGRQLKFGVMVFMYRSYIKGFDSTS